MAWTSACSDVIFAFSGYKEFSGCWGMQPEWCLSPFKMCVLVYDMLSSVVLPHHRLLFPTRGRFQCVLSQFYIGLWALWDNYIWEEKHKTYTTYVWVIIAELSGVCLCLLFFWFPLFLLPVKVRLRDFHLLFQSFELLLVMIFITYKGANRGLIFKIASTAKYSYSQ